MKTLADAIISGKDIRSDETIAKHADWFDAFKDQYTFTNENVNEILFEQIGKTFVAVLEDAGVYKRTSDGEEAMMRFVRKAGGR